MSNENNITLKGGISKNNYALQALKKYISGDRSTTTEKDLPEYVLNELRQAVYNRELEKRNPQLYGVPEIVKSINKDIEFENNRPSSRIRNALGLRKNEQYIDVPKYLSGGIQYENYNPIKVDGEEWGGIAPIARTQFLPKFINDPSYNAQMSFGRANYTIDPKGNVVLTDRYNINKGTNLASPLGNVVHTVAKYLNKGAYDSNINLGNINDWGLNYTGNDYNRAFNKNKYLGYGYYERSYDPNP